MRKVKRKVVLIAAALGALIALGGIVAAVGGGGEEGGSVAATAAPAVVSAADEEADRATEAGAAPPPAEAAPASDGAGEALPASLTSGLPTAGPRVVQTASLTLTVPTDRFDETIDRARQIATSLGGFVTSSSAVQGAGERLVRGTLVVRVPGPAYAQAMAALGELGQVKQRREEGTDVSGQYVDLEARRNHLEAVERQLLTFLERTTTVAAALAVQDRLSEVQAQLEEVRGRLRYLDDQTSYATISLTVAERGVPVVSGQDEGWGIGDAWAAAARGFLKVVGGALVGLATAGPVLALLALALLGWRLARRRRAARREVGPADPATP